MYDEDAIDLSSSIDDICDEALAKVTTNRHKPQHIAMKQPNSDPRRQSPDIQSVKQTDGKNKTNFGTDDSRNDDQPLQLLLGIW